MPKVAIELAAIVVQKLGEGVHAVGGVPGLLLNVTATGGKTWLLRVRVGSKRREIGLGGYPGVPLAQAKVKARELREAIANGLDPVAERAKARATLKAQQATAKTFEQCARAYIEDKKGQWKNHKHRAQWLSTLETYAFPIIGKMDVFAIDLPKVMEVLTQEQTTGGTKAPLWEAKTETASRVRGRMEVVLDWATVREYRAGLNPARWKGHLAALLKAPNKLKKVKPQPALPIDEMAEFMQVLRTMEGTGAKGLEFTILTAVRSEMVRGAKWSEIDKKSWVWTIPAARMKKPKEHRVPLSTQARALLERIVPEADNDLVFPAPRGGEMSDSTLNAVIERMNEPVVRWIDPTQDRQVVTHGFRSTFRGWSADRTDFPRDLCEYALSHALDNKTEAAYMRTDMLEKRRTLMQAWANYCDHVGEATVIPFPHGKKQVNASS